MVAATFFGAELLGLKSFTGSNGSILAKVQMGSREVDDFRHFIGFQGGREQREMRKHRQVGFYHRFHIISRCWFSKFFFIFTPTC